jgi:hypothetical protein
LSSIEPEFVTRRETSYINLKVLKLESNIFDSLFNLKYDCFRGDKLISTHLELQIDYDIDLIKFFIKNSVPSSDKRNLLGVLYIKGNKIPCLVYTKANFYFKETEKIQVLKYNTIFNEKNEESFEKGILIDSYNGFVYDYLWETCYK